MRTGIIKRVKENAKTIDWKMTSAVIVGTQFLFPFVWYLIEGDGGGFIVSTGFCCVILYPSIVKLLLFGK